MEKVKKWLRIFAFTLLIFLLMLAALYIFRENIMMWAGNRLIKQDILQKSDAIFVFSGQARERGIKAAELYKKEFADKIYCTGSIDLKVFKTVCDKDMHEGQVTQMVLLKNDVPKSAALLLEIGTSTMEECHAVIEYAKEMGMKKIIIVSSMFHTRRIHGIIQPLAQNNGIKVIVCGAPSMSFDENRWWDNEDGLIFVNNEYVKLLYYALKY